MMSEENDFANWIAERREKSPLLDDDFCAEVMGRIRRLEARPSIGEMVEKRVAAFVGRIVPESRREVVYFGGSAFAGALRVGVILYFVIGIS